MSTFDRKKCISPSHPKAIANHALLQSLTLYHSTLNPSNSRGISPQFQAYESKAKMSIGDKKAPSVDGKDCIPLCNEIRESMIEIAYEMTTPDDVIIDPVTLGGSTCYWISHPGQHAWKDGRFIVYYHGMFQLHYYIIYNV